MYRYFRTGHYTAKKLGYDTKLLFYRLAETYKAIEKFEKAMLSVSEYLKRDNSDIKIYKLQAQILIEQKKYKKALVSYDYVFTKYN